MVLPDDIQVQHVSFDASRVAVWMRLLSDEEQARLEAFRSQKRVQHFLMGRVAARTLLARALGTAPAAVPLKVAEDGAVDVQGDDRCLSIAHTADRAVAVAARRPIGVDVERVRARHRDLPSILVRPDEEAQFAAFSGGATRAGILWWTLKEATLKAQRTGLRVSPKTLRVQLGARDGAAHVIDAEGTRWHARYTEADGFIEAVVYR